ncbi:MAG: ASKHA domain-containing protein, partial [SAR202 cluster bacterium]|nr:ASKHA domain-containing protein [SAR202 cluster bacterium]
MESLNHLTQEETFLRGNYRLACQAVVEDLTSDVEFSTLRRQPKILTSGVKRLVNLDSLATKRADRVFIEEMDVDRYQGHILGLAGDIGTTTIVLSIVDLESGDTLATSSFENPQRFGGSDVMNRISYDGGPNKGELKKVLLSSINYEIGEMLREHKIHRRRIYDAVLVGNTTMRDILFGVNVQTVGEKPYKSIIQHDMESGSRESTAINISAKELGLRIFPQARIYSGPIIGCHVGADVAADLLAITADETENPIMLVDIGTNTEVVIGTRDKMVAASCPAGPAFEGGEVTYGMPGYEGAVESVKIRDGILEIDTIGDAGIQGICGSGLIDLLAELRKSNLMTELGVYSNGNNAYIFSEDENMALYRSDISALAQAKSANYCGQYLALRHFGAPISKISKLYLAGGFANYINSSNARDIGFIANFPLKKIEKVGNASLEGAVLMLKSIKMRIEIEKLVLDIEHLELETIPDFFEVFVEGCMFNPMPRDLTSI